LLSICLSIVIDLLINCYRFAYQLLLICLSIVIDWYTQIAYNEKMI